MDYCGRKRGAVYKDTTKIIKADIFSELLSA
jgi:hypothetical protein